MNRETDLVIEPTMPDDPNTHHQTFMKWISELFTREPKNRDQLIQLLRSLIQKKILEADALAMIEGVLQVSEMQVREIMIPRAQMIVVKQDAKPKALLPTVTKSKHSRFPVIADNRDEVVGILLAKDLLPFSFNGEDEKFNMRDILRPAVFIPESKRLNVLLREFRATRNHMAIVVDEYGSVVGLVTIEDVLEQIVGEIEDEYDLTETESNIKKINATQYYIKAITSIEDFNEHFHTEFNAKEFDSVGGLVLKYFGHLPKRGESIKIGDYKFKIMRVDHRRIHLLQMTIPRTKKL